MWLHDYHLIWSGECPSRFACLLPDLHDALGGKVPIGLLSSNWGGTGVRKWMPKPALAECAWKMSSKTNPDWWDNLWNTMIAPFAVGPMALSGAIWYAPLCCFAARPG